MRIVVTVNKHQQFINSLNTIEDKRLLPIYSMAHTVTNKTVEEAFEILKNVRNRKTEAALTKIDELLDHGTLPLELTCTHKDCKKQGKYKVDLEVSTLLPFREFERPDDLGIIFG